jgi:hypothetical protein
MEDELEEFYDLEPMEFEADEQSGYHFGDEKKYLSIAESLAKDGRDASGKENPDMVYRPEYAQVAYELCRAGATDKGLAEAFAVVPSTITAWKKKYPRFGAMTRGGKIFGNLNVVNSAYKSATGFKIKTEKLISVPLGMGMGSDVERHTVTEYIPPNPRMVQYWLNNRDPDNWSDKSTIDMKNNGGSFSGEASQMSNAELAQRAADIRTLEDGEA